jgi:hypothetical protein
MMTPQEQLAFVDAYTFTVAEAPREVVTDFVERYSAGEDIEYTGDYTSIVDALGMWHAAIMFALTRGRE